MGTRRHSQLVWAYTLIAQTLATEPSRQKGILASAKLPSAKLASASDAPNKPTTIARYPLVSSWEPHRTRSRVGGGAQQQLASASKTPTVANPAAAAADLKPKAASAVPRARALAPDLVRLSRPEGRARAAKVASVTRGGAPHTPTTLVLGMPTLQPIPPTPKPPMTCHTHWGSTNRAVRTATAVLSEKDLLAAPSTTLGEDTDLASADLLRDVRGDTTSTSDPPAAAWVHRRAPRGCLIRTSAQIQA